MPDTDATEFGLWPTPHANCNTGAGSHGTGADNIQTAVKMWPTPGARDWKDSPGMATTGTNPDGTTRNRIDQLARAVYFQEAGAKSSLPPSSTPKATDSAHADSTTQKDVASQGQLKTDTNTLSAMECFTEDPKKPEHSGSLNPNWVEWLMGYPIGHTVCEGWETRSSRRLPKKSSEQSPT
jgi:DNA (cytosine-5)-methyltransferase 1